MDSLPINPADLIVLAIIVISGLLAFARGLVREVLSIVGWVGAAIITLYGIPYVRPYVGMFVRQDQIVVDVVGGTIIFILTLVALSLASVGVARQVKDSQLNALDRSLGFAFGVARGMVLICLSYMVIVWSLPPADHPKALREARTLPFIETGAELIKGLVPESWRGGATARRSEDMRRDAEAEARRAAGKAMETLIQPQVRSAPPRETQGYNEQERQQLDRLLQGAKEAPQ
jgi:membrane protein required for colicin V production